LHNALAGDQTQIPKSESTKQPAQMVLSSLLPVIADGQALKVKVAEARRIILKLDQETLSAKSKLPAVKGVFEPVHFGLAKPAKPGEYGGGMLARLEFIEKNLAKSLQDMAKLPSSCDASQQARWKAASESQKLLLKTIIQAKQARAQAAWTARQSGKLIKTAKRQLKGAKDGNTHRALDAYNKKLQDGLAAVARALGKGLDGKSLGKKLMPTLDAKCGNMLTARLPSVKEAGNLLAGVGGANVEDSKLIENRITNGYASTGTYAKVNNPAQKADLISSAPKALAVAPSAEFYCPQDCPRLAALDLDWWINDYFPKMLKLDPCPSTSCTGLAEAKACKAMYLAKCVGKKCPDGQTLDNDGKSCVCLDGSKPDKNGKCLKKCPAGQVLKSDGTCGCGIEGQKPNSAGVCSCGEGQAPVRIPWYTLGAKTCAPACGGKAYDSKKDCCSGGEKSGDLFKADVVALRFLGVAPKDCPQRVPKYDEATKEKVIPNGCTVPWYAWGPAKVKGAATKDDPVGGGEATSFRKACDKHDVCYGSCNNTGNDPAYRAGCDGGFALNLINLCGGLRNEQWKTSCDYWRDWYDGQVTGKKGAASYNDAQQKWCKCCPRRG
jgi:hypothetical protein